MDPRPDDETVNPAEASASDGVPAPASPNAANTPPEAGSPTTGSGEGSEASMAAALTPPPPAGKASHEPRKGGRLKGKIVKIGEESAFVDFGGREEAILDLKEIRDAEGKLQKNVGDEVQGVVVDVEGGVRVSLRGGAGGHGGRAASAINVAALIEAASSGLPVEGRVTGVNKGGLVVQVLGARAFCPFSQIDRHWVEDPSVYVGQKMMFRVSTADPKGRNVVVSRRALLEQDTKVKADSLRQQIAVGQVVKGVVARLRPFGAFVDIGGIDGLIHVSEISHSRVKDPSDLLKVGQAVEVKVRSVENLGRTDERIGLSLKDLQADPWTAVAGNLKPGAIVHGKVVRLADFGAFLEIGPGVDGLAHVSTLADRRVGHPSEVLEVGQELDVWVVSVDPSNRRVSLSVMDPATRAERSERGGGGGRPPREGGGESGPSGWSGAPEPWSEPAPFREGGRRDRGKREGGKREGGGRRETGRREREGGGRRDRDWADEHDRGFRDSGMTSMQEAFERMRESGIKE